MKLFTVRHVPTEKARQYLTADDRSSVECGPDEIVEDGHTYRTADVPEARRASPDEQRSAMMRCTPEEVAALWELVGLLWTAANPLAKSDAKTKAKHSKSETVLKRVVSRIEAAKIKYPYPVFPDAVATIAASLAPMTLQSRAAREARATVSLTLAPMTLRANSLPVRAASVVSTLDALTVSIIARAEIEARIVVGLAPVTLHSIASVDVPIIPEID